MNKGTVKFFNESKGFGFIVEDDSKTEHFVHVSGLVNDIRENDKVEYDLQDGRKGLNAVNVKVIKTADGGTPCGSCGNIKYTSECTCETDQ